MKPGTWLRLSTLFVVFAALSGCAGVYRVDNQVESFARWSQASGPASVAQAVPTPPQQYRFERLPSQGSGASGQSQNALEHWAQDILLPLGWTRIDDSGKAGWTIQVAESTNQLPHAPWEHPLERDDFDWLGQGWVGVGTGQVMWNPWLMHNVRPYYQREVSLVIRESATGRVVYETRAAHDGRWNSTPALWQAMLTAALADFPNPPTGMRSVNLDLPR
jgi:hypothetical protein